MAGVLDALLEGFAAEQTDPFPHSQFTVGDHVQVQVRGKPAGLTGRVVRAHGGPPPTHAVVAPHGGGAHVLAPVQHVKLATPGQHVAHQQAQARAEAQASGLRNTARPMQPPAASGRPNTAKVVRGGLREAFAGAPPAETPAQSQQRGAAQVAQAQSSLRAGWNASKHPRAQGGKFGYTTGGKRAKRAKGSSSRTLGQGSSGALVKSVQRTLGVAADGKYGPQTHSAVTRYQQVHHLQVDGVIGAQTLAALRGHPNPSSVKPGPIPSRAATIKAHPATRAHPRAKAPAKPKAPVRLGGGIVVR